MIHDDIVADRGRRMVAARADGAEDRARAEGAMARAEGAMAMARAARERRASAPRAVRVMGEPAATRARPTPRPRRDGRAAPELDGEREAVVNNVLVRFRARQRILGKL